MTASRKTTTAFATVVALLVVAVAYLVARQPVEANHQPADKVVAAGQKVTTIDGEAPGAEPEGTAILTSTFKTSGPTDLMVHVSLECAILTTLNNQGGTNAGRTSATEAEGEIRVWLEFDGQEVAIDQMSTTPQPSDPAEIGNDDDKVTFCLNERSQTVSDAENVLDGHDTLSTYLRTKQANAFNWIIMNTGGWSDSNIHTLVVKASLTTATSATEGSSATAQGFVGNRMAIIEPTKMSNHASV